MGPIRSRSGAGPGLIQDLSRVDSGPMRGLREPKSSRPPQCTRPFFKGMLRGLVVTHALGVVHRDVKPNNFMCCLGPGGHRTVKLCDFGLASVLSVEKDALYATRVGVLVVESEAARCKITKFGYLRVRATFSTRVRAR